MISMSCRYCGFDTGHRKECPMDAVGVIPIGDIGKVRNIPPPEPTTAPATSAITTPEPVGALSPKLRAAVEAAARAAIRELAAAGGRARAARMTPAERSACAKRAGKAGAGVPRPGSGRHKKTRQPESAGSCGAG